MRAFAKGEPFLYIEAAGENIPTFSEAFLYDRVGKSDARFILGVALEYAALIDALGTEKIRKILEEWERTRSFYDLYEG